MKYLLILIMLIGLGCSKKKTCWKCTLNTQAQNCATTKTVCSETDKLPADAYRDCNGNDFGGVCNKE